MMERSSIPEYKMTLPDCNRLTDDTATIGRVTEINQSPIFIILDKIEMKDLLHQKIIHHHDPENRENMRFMGSVAFRKII